MAQSRDLYKSARSLVLKEDSLIEHETELVYEGKFQITSPKLFTQLNRYDYSGNRVCVVDHSVTYSSDNSKKNLTEQVNLKSQYLITETHSPSRKGNHDLGFVIWDLLHPLVAKLN